MSVTYRVSFESDRETPFLSHLTPQRWGVLKDFNENVTFDDVLPTSATEVQETADLLEPMNNNCDAETNDAY
ncbi:hypothetical protein TNCV_4363571 [Trichonephila clavipes]|nr:hypothetical protein TNCV_4363571 [Trichonephila clavipes]